MRRRVSFCERMPVRGRRHQRGDLLLVGAAKSAIRTTWATAAQYEELSIR